MLAAELPVQSEGHRLGAGDVEVPACIQYRTLNKGKGPAVWSLRAQADRRRYQEVMKHTLELQENLWVGGCPGSPGGCFHWCR